MSELVDKQAVLRAISELSFAGYLNEVDIHDAVEWLPVVEEGKKGKWIRDGHHIRCDQCEMYMCDTDREGDRIPLEFCPKCGADMREEKEDD